MSTGQFIYLANIMNKDHYIKLFPNCYKHSFIPDYIVDPKYSFHDLTIQSAIV